MCLRPYGSHRTQNCTNENRVRLTTAALQKEEGDFLILNPPKFPHFKHCNFPISLINSPVAMTENPCRVQAAERATALSIGSVEELDRPTADRNSLPLGRWHVGTHGVGLGGGREYLFWSTITVGEYCSAFQMARFHSNNVTGRVWGRHLVQLKWPMIK